MIASNVVHSNAFNFMSYLQAGVDPRTGQYTLNISFPALNANALRGPTVPLQLGFSPLNTQDSGFGKGWSLNLSKYTPSTQMLALSTGESFKVTGSGNTPAIKERKLDSFHFTVLGDGTYRIDHKSGLVEVLKTLGTGTDAVALPHTIQAPSGHAVNLSYDSSSAFGWRLKSINDEQGELLNINYASENLIEIDIAPHAGEQGDPMARYTLALLGRELRTIELPSHDLASWRLTYTTLRDFLCVEEVKTPVGGRETIEYTDEGHAYPGTATHLKNLPRVTHHTTYPGTASDPSTLRVQYRYGDSDNDHNFLGFGASMSWEQNGLDNLYKAPSDYTYTSTSELMINGQPARTVKRTFNRFHLLIEEVTQQNNNINQVITMYHSTLEDFDDQPPQFQLPKQVDTVWKLANDATRSRKETVYTTFDESGNPLTEVQNSGITTTYSYYPSTGEGDDCPPDPQGFVRTLKEQTVIPSANFRAGGHTLRTHYRYQALPALASSGLEDWLVIAEERLTVVDAGQETELQVTQRAWINQPDDALIHGQPESEVQSFGDLKLATRTEYAYTIIDSLMAAEPVQQTVQTLIGYDGQSKVVTLQYSLFSGQPVLTRDDNDVEILYVYDVMQRVISETVAPGTEYAATRQYQYFLTSADGQRASQLLTDVKGVQTRSNVDGLNRPVYEERQNADDPARADVLRPTYAAVYNALGDLESETEFDWLETSDVPLSSRFEYDDWGQQVNVVGPEGVRSWELTDPIGSSEWKGPIVTAWQESTEGQTSQSTGKTVTWLNLYEKPERVERFGLGDNSLSVQTSEYDGLGRVVKEVDALYNETAFSYDAYNRMLSRTLPDDAKEEREYAQHSAEDLPVLIRVNDQLLGLQEFDGLDRMIRSVTGGREQTYAFDPGQSQPKSVTTPTQQQINYQYVPQLGEEPVLRLLPDEVEAHYTYDFQNARLLGCQEQGLSVERTYFSTGQLKSERCTQDASSYPMSYSYSLLGRILSYTDVLGQTQAYEYDHAARILSTTLGSTTSTFEYDGLGRTAKIATSDSVTSQRVEIQLEYDELGREVVRHFDLNGSGQTLTQAYNAVDSIVERTLSEGDILLRRETYTYDPRSRLESYTCDGPECPLDPYGQMIVSQDFIFDKLDNIKRVITQFPGGISNVADYKYESESDPVQLTGIRNTQAAIYPDMITLEYDANGNLTRDEQGRVLEYDALNRLTQVTSA